MKRYWPMVTGNVALAASIERGTEDFLTAWYGPSQSPIVAWPGDEPEPLRHWWSWQAAWGKPLSHQNVILGPEELYADEDRTVFYVENQAVVLWGYRGSGDPPVSERLNEASAEWIELGLTLSQFLLEVAVFEAGFGADNSVSASFVDEQELDHFTTDLVEYPCRGWPRSRIYAGDSLLVVATENAEPRGSWLVVAAAPSETLLDNERRLGLLEWD